MEKFDNDGYIVRILQLGLLLFLWSYSSMMTSLTITLAPVSISNKFKSIKTIIHKPNHKGAHDESGVCFWILRSPDMTIFLADISLRPQIYNLFNDKWSGCTLIRTGCSLKRISYTLRGFRVEFVHQM